MIKMTEIAHHLLISHLKVGNIAVDATCGNGFDTIFLAKLVGPSGLVHAYDIQAIAIDETKRKALSENLNNIIYHHASHELIDLNEIDAVIFNLGYLPKSDKKVTTKVSSTINALTNLLNKMESMPNLLIVLVVYPGHDEGKKESFAIERLLKDYHNNYWLLKCKLNNDDSPYVIAIKKRC